ncbi:hypothetical protein CEP52_006175 [Fusarium oligoseptatum]|uniref:Uncharacterized protein n=1 Tax=Fusarium oligoseptatum TaxID=2604345 RepID=A0A428TUG4_9HYPO|nr:hypothetical protein CEP52_006175 [Fusarium oligoseptatum]
MEDARQEFPPEESTADCAMTQPDTDSGYGGSSNASLETNDDHLDPEVGSAVSSSRSDPQPPSDTGTIQPQPQPIRIRPISKPIDRETARQANDVIEQMSLLLREHMVKSRRYKYLSRPKRNPPSMSIRPIMLGTTEEDAKTCLVIFCTDSHGAHDRIRDFLRKSFVKELYQPQDSSEPSFDVHVVGASPRTQAGVAVGIPIDNSRPDTSTCTLCGTSIYFVQEKSQQKQFATMGGILRLEFPDGTNDLYGLTAEHGAIDPGDPDDSDASVSDGGSGYDDSSSGPASPTAMVQIDFDLEPCLDVPTRDDQEMQSEFDDLGPVMARVEISALENIQNGAFRDWALFPLPTKDLEPKPNMLQLQGQQPKALKMPEGVTDMSESRTVQIITGSGLKRATLAPCLSRVLLKPGTSFVWAFTVELQANSDIRLGDSGSWVVDPLTLEVYGHLVATDVLLGAYVIPLVDIIEDIRSRFSKASIQFPSGPFLHSRDEAAMKPSLAPGSAVSWEDFDLTITSAYDQNVYGSNSMAQASTIDGTEPPASVFSQPISIATAASSSIDPWGDVFKFGASETLAGWTGLPLDSMAGPIQRGSRHARWKTSSMRKMARLYTYTTLSLAKILEVIHNDPADPMPGLESANKKIHTLLDKQPRWIHPQDRDDMRARLRELAKSPFRQKHKHHKSNPNVNGASPRNVSRQSTDQKSEHHPPFQPSQRSTARPPKSSITLILSDYSPDYVNDVEMLMSRYSLEETLDADADSSGGVSARDNWLHDPSSPAAKCSETTVPGDFLRLDELLFGHEFCGQELNHGSSLYRVRDEVSPDDWVTTMGPTPKATDILTPVIAIPASAFSLADSFGNTMLHLLAARDTTKTHLLRAVSRAPESILIAANTANQTFLHVLGTFWFENVTSQHALLPILLGWLSRRSFDIYARDIYGRNFFHICQANLRDKSTMERIIMPFGRGNFAYRDAFGVIPTGLNDYPRPPFEQKTEPSPGNTPLTRLLSELRAAISDPLLEDSSGRNGLHLLADAILSEDTIRDNPRASVGKDGRSRLHRSANYRRPQTNSSFQMLSLRKSVMEELLRAGVDPNHYNNDGNTVLMAFAARLPEDDDYRLPCQIIEALVKAGARVNARNRRGETALHIAVRTGHKLVTKALVEAGANVYARDVEGRSVLDVADTTALQSKDVKDYAHAEAARAWLSGLQARAVQNPTVKQEWGAGRR